MSYNVLISAYACSPYEGSEPGVGWNFVNGLASTNNLTVLVEKKFEKDIVSFLANSSDDDIKRVKFLFIKRVRLNRLRRVWPPSYYWTYRLWQFQAFKLAKEISLQENFDVVHHLTMVGFREPGYLWRLNIPFVWGPIGGLEITPWQLLPLLDLGGFVHLAMRNIFNIFQRSLLPRPRKILSLDNRVLLSATKRNSEAINRIWGYNSDVLSEVGMDISGFRSSSKTYGKRLKICWSGIHESRKNLNTLLRVLAEVSFPFELHILGAGKLTNKWKHLASKLNVDEFCIWHGRLSRFEALSVMGNCDICCITSIHDLTSTVLIEALSLGLPTVTFDLCGFTDVVNENCGAVVPVSKLKNPISEYRRSLENLYENRNKLPILSKNASLRALDFQWSAKIQKINEVYKVLIDEKNNG